MDAKGVRIEGSSLIEKLVNTDEPGGRYVLSPPTKPAIMKLSMAGQGAGEIRSFDDVVGQLTGGKKSVTFRGETFGGCTTISMRCEYNSDGMSTVDFTIESDFQQWSGREVKSLPYFDDALRFFQLVRNGWKIDATLSVEGIRVLQAAGSLPSDSDQLAPACVFLEYTRLARTIAGNLNQPINVNLSNATRDTDRSRLAQVQKCSTRRERARTSLAMSNINDHRRR